MRRKNVDAAARAQAAINIAARTLRAMNRSNGLLWYAHEEYRHGRYRAAAREARALLAQLTGA